MSRFKKQEVMGTPSSTDAGSFAHGSAASTSSTNISSAIASSTNDSTESFIRLIGQHERMLSAFVMTMLPNLNDSDDILQETKIALWQSFGSFKPGTDFGAWARQAAMYRILDFRKRMAREKLRFGVSEECYIALAKQYEDNTDSRAETLGKLAGCLARLPDDQKKVIQMRYMEKLDIQQIADNCERTHSATYRLLSRIRLSLRKCMSYQVPSPAAS